MSFILFFIPSLRIFSYPSRDDQISRFLVLGGMNAKPLRRFWAGAFLCLASLVPGALHAQVNIVVGSTGAYNIGPTSATIEWVSNEPANSQVNYGLTTGYGSSTPFDPTISVCHSELVSDLSTGTVYNAQGVSTDSVGNTGFTPNISFQTQVVPPAAGIGWVTYITSATISWFDNDPGDTEVHYGLTPAYGSNFGANSPVLNADSLHTATLTGLSPNTPYYFDATSTDTAEGITLDWDAVLGYQLQFLTQPAPNLTPPIISVVAAQPLISSATISWGTNKLA
jgi:hypothetical protein